MLIICEEVKKIKSTMEKHIRFTGGDGSSEDVRDRQFGNHLNSFYNQVMAIVRDADPIQIFGPDETKGELKKHLEQKGVKEHILAVETVDKMTDRQIAAKVHEYLSK